MDETKLAVFAVRHVLLLGLMTVGELSAYGQEQPASTALLPPTRVEAENLPIDIDAGGAAPWYADFDGDGRADLLVGQWEGGKLRIYRNVGSNEQPQFNGFEWFRAAPAGVICQVIPSPPTDILGGPAGFTPQLVDFDGDGLQDLLSRTGNGTIVVFYRQEDGSFAKGESITLAGDPQVPDTGASMHAADWDGDGDLDLVVAVEYESLRLVRNTGSRRQPTYADPEPFKEDDGKELRYRIAAPVMADWDGDGLLDLVVGAENGSVTFYRHVGAAEDTTLAERRVLVPPAFRDEDNAAPQPGNGARPCVCDFNGDGRLDLLVGDVWTSVMTPEIQLTDEEREHDSALEKKLVALSRKFSAERKVLDNDTGEAREGRLEGLRVISIQMRAMRRELARPLPQPIVTVHGHVWVYLRGK